MKTYYTRERLKITGYQRGERFDTVSHALFASNENCRSIPTIGKVGRENVPDGRTRRRKKQGGEQKGDQEGVGSCLVRQGEGGDRVQLRRKEGSKYAGQVGGRVADEILETG